MRAFVCAAVLLAGCASQPVPPPPATWRPVCLQVDDWNATDRAALGEALKPFPDKSVMIRMALEWNRLRAESIACASASH